MRTAYTLGPEDVRALPGSPGFSVRLSRDARKGVVFLGYPEREKGPTAIRCEGTGFLLLYKGGFHLVTARHVAKTLGDIGWATRVNRLDGTCELIDAEDIPWAFHPDDTVDIAVCGFSLSRSAGYDFLYYDGEILLLNAEQESSADWVEVGDMCYTVGLWRLLEGKERNLPVVHTGSIARLPGEEKIPVRAPNKPGGRELVDGYLVEAQTLRGLSGSPVFIRPSLNLAMDATRADPFGGSPERIELVAYHEHVKLLGLWQAAWDAPAGEVLTAEHGRQNTVPVGMGIVVPASKIIEVLELPAVHEKREKQKRLQDSDTLAEPQSVSSGAKDDLAATDANPSHQEDFTRLVNAAARMRAPKD